MIGMGRWLIKAIESWFRLPRVALLYIPLYVVSAIPMFTSDPDNPLRAFSFTLPLWAILTGVSAVVASVVVGLITPLRKKRLSAPTFNATFIVTWIVIFSVMYK